MPSTGAEIKLKDGPDDVESTDRSRGTTSISQQAEQKTKQTCTENAKTRKKEPNLDALRHRTHESETIC